MGIIGDPIDHSRSPALHNLFAKAEGIDTVYVPFPLKSGNVGDALAGAHALHVAGLNVTMPHKKAVIEYLDGIDPAAEALGAVNTLVRTERGYRGYNTDVVGFEKELKGFQTDFEGQEAIVIGAGGVSGPVIHVLQSMKLSHIWLLNRTVEKAEEKFGHISNVTVLPLDGFREIPEGRHLCVQCTGVGMGASIGRAPIEDPGFYKRIGKAVDLIYSPEETEFMRLVREAGGEAKNGLEMLLYQAVESYRLFTGHQVSPETVEMAGKAVCDV